MKLVQKISFKNLFSGKGMSAAAAYNSIADFYDEQPDNLLQILDEELFKTITNNVEITGKIIADIGCGTGRHWPYLLAKDPRDLIGFDASEKMLEKLKAKHFPATVYMQENNKLSPLNNQTCDLIISTLTIGYKNNINQAFEEWNRVLKPNGEIVLTDYHPEFLSKGADRKFSFQGISIEAKNYIHSIEKITDLAYLNGWKIISYTERKLDAELKTFYAKKNALHVYEKFYNTPMIYGLHLKKSDAAS